MSNSLSLMGVGLRTIRPNLTRLTLGGLTIWFSYETPISFEDRDFGEVATRVNDWGTATGRHLNLIEEDHSVRVSGELFQRLLNEALMRVGSH